MSNIRENQQGEELESLSRDHQNSRSDVDTNIIVEVEESRGEEDEIEEVEIEEVDPRVQGELETLNSASDDINTLETELERSRNKFRAVLAESTQSLNVLFKKLGKCVLKARPYYALLKDSKQAQAEAQRAVLKFQRANSVYQAAKEMVQLAEERNFPEDGDSRRFDSAWQEMLNHATIKFMSSEKDKATSEQEHMEKAEQYADIQQKLRAHLKDMPRNINKAKAYFDLKDKLEQQLQVERVNVEDLQMGLVCAKHKYRSALTNLEAISEEIHQKRKKRLQLPPRTPGVGAESDVSSLPSVNLDNLSDTASFMSLDDLDGDCASVKEDDPEQSSPSATRHTPKQLLLAPAMEQRQAVAEGSESNASSSHQEEPLSPQQLALCHNYMQSIIDVNEKVIPDHCGQEKIIPSHPDIRQMAPGHSIPMQEHLLPSSSSNPGYNMNRVRVETQKMHRSPTKRQQQKLQIAMAFPILQGLTGSQPLSGQAANQAYQMSRPQAAWQPAPQQQSLQQQSQQYSPQQYSPQQYSPHQSPQQYSPHQSPQQYSPHQSPQQYSPHQSPQQYSPHQSPQRTRERPNDLSAADQDSTEAADQGKKEEVFV